MTVVVVEEGRSARRRLVDRAGDEHYAVTSRSSSRCAARTGPRSTDLAAAEGGEDPVRAQRMVILASEDVGNADRTRCWWRLPRPAVELIGLPRGSV